MEGSKLQCPGGREILTQSTATGIAGAWLNLDGPDKCLCLVVEPPHAGKSVHYIGYRDGVVKRADKLAVSVDDAGGVTVQLVTKCDEGHEHIHQFTLDQLEEMVKRCNPTPPPA